MSVESNPTFSVVEGASEAELRMALIERYVRTKEKQAAGAKPDIDYIEENSCDQAEALIARLAAISPGREAARDYQFLVLEILNYLFNPDLTDGQPEVRTFDGTERRDIIFTNESGEAFGITCAQATTASSSCSRRRTPTNSTRPRSTRPQPTLAIASADWASLSRGNRRQRLCSARCFRCGTTHRPGRPS